MLLDYDDRLLVLGHDLDPEDAALAVEEREPDYVLCVICVSEDLHYCARHRYRGSMVIEDLSSSHVYIYIYIYITREREREIER